MDEIQNALTSPPSPPAVDGTQATIRVSGSGVDLASEAICHSEHSTSSGVVKRLTEIVRLDGDLCGYVLYRPIQAFDTVENKLVITGTNVFSGTIAGSEPVILRSDHSRFEVDLVTGHETGNVHLTRSLDVEDPGPWYECDLVVVGTGQTPDGNPTFDYHGLCTRHDPSPRPVPAPLDPGWATRANEAVGG